MSNFTGIKHSPDTSPETFLTTTLGRHRDQIEKWRTPTYSYHKIEGKEEKKNLELISRKTRKEQRTWRGEYLEDIDRSRRSSICLSDLAAAADLLTNLKKPARSNAVEENSASGRWSEEERNCKISRSLWSRQPRTGRGGATNRIKFRFRTRNVNDHGSSSSSSSVWNSNSSQLDLGFEQN